MKRVLVTGATGAIGPTLVRLLVSRGYLVRVLIRKKNDIDSFSPEIEVEFGDIKDPESVKRAVSGVEIIFHLAALLHHNHPGSEMEQEYHKVNVEGTLNLIKASCKEKVKRFIFFSTISVYGKGNKKAWLCEEDSVCPKTFYEKTKYEAELLLKDFSRKGTGPGITILRLSSVYGTRVKGNYRTMIRAISKGFFIYPGTGLNKRTLVHEEDAARAALIASEHPDAAGKTYNVTDGTIHSVKEIVNSISSGLNQRVFILYLPSYPFRLINHVLKSSILMKVPLLRRITELIDKMNENVEVSGKKMIDDLNFKPKWDLDSGMKDAIAEIFMVKSEKIE